MNGKTKSETTKELLGIDYDKFTKWIEFQLPACYTMNDLGKILHIDHVNPFKNFDMSDNEQVKIVMHWTNHKPLEASKNLKKSTSYNPWMSVCQEIKAKYFLKKYI